MERDPIKVGETVPAKHKCRDGWAATTMIVERVTDRDVYLKSGCLRFTMRLSRGEYLKARDEARRLFPDRALHGEQVKEGT